MDHKQTQETEPRKREEKSERSPFLLFFFQEHLEIIDV